MKKLVLFISVLFGTIVLRAESGERPAKDSNQQVTKLSIPQLDAVVTYLGGDTLFVSLTSEGSEPVQLKLLGDETTLLNDPIPVKPEVNRTYVIAALPKGTYKIRMKKGNYVVEKSFTKLTPAVDQ